MEDLSRWLAPTESMCLDDPRVRDLSRSIVSAARDDREASRLLFEHVRDRIEYSIYVPFFLMEHYRATAIIERGWGYCVQKAVVLCALARSAGIPARLVFADIRNMMTPRSVVRVLGQNLFVYHCYVEMHVGGRWLQATPSFDRKLCERHRYPLVEYDGTRDAIFPPVDREGRPFVEYVRHIGKFDDVPLNLIIPAWIEAYGANRVESWKLAFTDGTHPPGVRWAYDGEGEG